MVTSADIQRIEGWCKGFRQERLGRGCIVSWFSPPGETPHVPFDLRILLKEKNHR
jgi:hypothetical protein